MKEHVSISAILPEPSPSQEDEMLRKGWEGITLEMPKKWINQNIFNGFTKKIYINFAKRINVRAYLRDTWLGQKAAPNKEKNSG